MKTRREMPKRNWASARMRETGLRGKKSFYCSVTRKDASSCCGRTALTGSGMPTSPPTKPGSC
jgi:hypothetical protein